MARRARAPKAPPVLVVYEESPAIAEVAHRLIRLFATKFAWTANFKLGYVLVTGSKRRDDRRFDAMAKFRKTPPLYHGLSGFDAVIEVHAWAWGPLTAEQQEALVAHELCHGSMSEKGTLRVERHDLEEFVFVVREYGAWQPDIAEFDHQLRMFDERGATIRTPRAEQQTLSPVGEATKMLGEIVEKVVTDALDAPEPTPISRKRNGGQQPPVPLS
jgi:hypothetical protein